MKTFNKALFAAALTVSLMAAGQAVAGDNSNVQIARSPKAQSQVPVAVTVSSVNDINQIREVALKNGSPKAKSQWTTLQSVAILNRTDSNRDLAKEIRYQNGSPKAISQQSPSEVTLAPVK